MADTTHVNHEDMSETACMNCDMPNSANTMSCCFDTDEKQVNLTGSSRIQSDNQELPSFIEPAITYLDTTTTQHHKYLVLAYKPPLIRVGITVKKE